MRRSAHVVLLALTSSLLVVTLGGSPSSARSGTGYTHASSASSWSSARVTKHKKHHKKKHRKRKPARRNPWTYCWPGVASLSAARVSGAVQFRWPGTSCTTRYRLRVSPAWYGEWPGAPWYTRWTTGSARSLNYAVPTTPRAGDGMLATAYANPVFAQLEANNGSNTRTTATHRSTWKAQWPSPPAPRAGDPVRFGSYNVMLYPTGSRAAVVAQNIGSHGVTMVALQEARQTTASDVVAALNSPYSGTWDYVRAHGATTSTPGQQILYRTDLFTLVDSGVYSMANPKDANDPVVGPWAAFEPLHQDGSRGHVFYVTSVHFAGTPRSSLQQNAWTGAAAKLVNDYMANLTNAPTIVAGDLRYGREPFGDTPGYVPAQPTFVRDGYYDAMASQAMHGQNYSEVNATSDGTPSAHQVPNPSGSGPRSDHILMKGIVGSLSYTNVVNWSYGGVVPSDHNLIFSDILIPQS
jgi:hypothetical protein